MKKTWGRFFRRRSNMETELQKDYPTNSDSEDFSNDAQRRQEWQRHLNQQVSHANAGPSNTMEEEGDGNWEYESEYNYSISSGSSIIDAYKEQKYREPHILYSESDLERRIEHAMRYEFHAEDDVRHNHSSYPSNEDRRHRIFPQGEDRRERFNSGNRQLSPVGERIRQFEKVQGKRRAVNEPQTAKFSNLPMRQEIKDTHGATWNSFGKKKVRKQVKQRRRAGDVSSEFSDEGDQKYAVNITMEDLNNLIKKNINSAVKRMASEKPKSRKYLSPCESFSTETETIFSNSSSHSSEIPAGLLQKQIKAQLDKDKLKGIIKHAVAKEASDVLHKSLNATTPLPTIPKINEIPPSPAPSYLPNFGTPQQHAMSQYQPHCSMAPSHIPAAPPPPPASTLPPSVTFSIPGGNHNNGMPMYTHGDNLDLPHTTGRRHSLAPAFANFNSFNRDQFGNISPMPPEQNINPYAADNALNQAHLNRMQHRRHTLSALDEGGDIDKMEQFSNALKLLDKTIKQAENSNETKSKEVEGKMSDNNEGNRQDEHTAQDPSSITIAPLPGGVLAPFQSIADQIAALSKKKEKPLEEGQIPMTACARTFLILSNIVFLISGCGLSGLGAWMMTDPNIETYFDILNVNQASSDFKMICYVLLAIGVFAFIIAFMGCCGAMHKSQCLLTLFLIMVAVLTVLEAGLGVMVVMGKDSPTAIPVLSAVMSDMEDQLRTQLKYSLVKFYLPETMLGSTWDIVQIQLECCGATGPDDYKYSAWTNDTRPETDYPDTCCVLMSKDAEVPEPSNKLLCHFGTAGFYFDTGCYEKMIGWFKDNSKYIIAAGASIVVLEIIGFTSACIICKKGQKELAAKESKQ